MRNRRPVESDITVQNYSGFRLRHLLAGGLVLCLGYALYPRAKAAWKLHDQATHFANYGSCMVGPTGPETLYQRPREFYQLVRRRLLIASASSAPFEACADLAASIGGSDFEALHQLTAAAYVEYAGTAEPSASLSEMQVSAQYLSELADAAWPFVRSGFAQLVKPSSHAKEAPHPLPFERPALGSGLPALRAAYHTTWSDGGRLLLSVGHSSDLRVFESSDSGLNWRPTSLSQPGIGKHAGRCTTSGDPRGFAFEGGSDGVSVISLSGDEAVWRKPLGSLRGVINASCDGPSALVVGPTRSGKNALFVCRHTGNCGQVRVPQAWLEGEFDIARVASVNVVVTLHQGVARVRSTRDEGASWTPPTVAFDYQSYPDLPTQGKLPTRLLSVGKRLYLHGVSRGSGQYPVLYSDDYGASFRGTSVLSRPQASAADPSYRTTNPVVGLAPR